jgi:hypothetical protein
VAGPLPAPARPSPLLLPHRLPARVAVSARWPGQSAPAPRTPPRKLAPAKARTLLGCEQRVLENRHLFERPRHLVGPPDAQGAALRRPASGRPSNETRPLWGWRSPEMMQNRQSCQRHWGRPPLGMSGARLVVPFLHELRRRGGHFGLATMCAGSDSPTTSLSMPTATGVSRTSACGAPSSRALMPGAGLRTTSLRSQTSGSGRSYSSASACLAGNSRRTRSSKKALLPCGAWSWRPEGEQAGGRGGQARPRPPFTSVRTY